METDYEDQLRRLCSAWRRQNTAVERRKLLETKARKKGSGLLPEGALEAAKAEERAARKQFIQFNDQVKDIERQFGLMAPFKIIYHVFRAGYEDPDWLSRGGNHPDIKTHPD